MRYSLVQAEQDRDDLPITVDGFELLVEHQIVEEKYNLLAIDYSSEKGFIIRTDGKTFRHRTLVTRRPVTPRGCGF